MKKNIVKLKFDDWISAHILEDREGNVTSCTTQIGLFMSLKMDVSRCENVLRHYRSESCPYCGDILSEKDERFSDGFTISSSHYKVCSSCGCWRFFSYDSALDDSFSFPLVRQFNPNTQLPSIVHLSQEILKKNAQLYSIDPYRFERFVGSVISEHYDCEVYHVGQSGDDGVDLVAIVSDSPLLIQVKRRGNPDAVEGIDVVKLLFASAFGQGANSGMLVTTASRFTKPATEWVQNNRLKDTGFSMELKDINDLMHMIEAVADTNADPPWTLHRTFMNGHSEDRNWKLKRISNGCLLTLYETMYEKDRRTALLIDYDFLERYWIFEQVSLNTPEIGADSTIGATIELLASHSSCHSCTSQAYDFEMRWGISDEIMKELYRDVSGRYGNDLEKSIWFSL